MKECRKRGCRNLQTTCIDCSRIVCSKILPAGGWISVNDSLPNDGQMIAVCVMSTQMGCVGRYCANEDERLPCLIYGPLKILGFTWTDVTHWIAIPTRINE